jgi:hypothetical protein
MAFNTLDISRRDASINFNWTGTSPDPSVPQYGFSVRWQGNFTFGANNYTFTTVSDDGVRLYVDGTMIINDWTDHSSTTDTASHVMSAGTHLVVMEYYQDAGGSVAQLSWSVGTPPPPPPPPNGVATPTIIPNGGSFSGPIRVGLQDATANAAIYYTLDGSVPTLSSTLYTLPFMLNQSATVQALASVAGVGQSLVASAAFTIAGSTLPTPDLGGLPAVVGVNDSLNLSNYPNSNVSFLWSFGPSSTSSSSAPGVVARTASGTSFPSGARTNSLSSYGLGVGVYQVTVQAVDQNNNMSNPSQPRTITLVNSDFSAVQVFPNPWRSDKHAGHPSITFANLPANCTVKIFTTSGRKAREFNNVSGSMNWDLTNDSGDKVASGVYVYLITDAQGNKIKGKIGIIR